MKAPTWVEKNIEVNKYKDKCMEMHQKKLHEIKEKGPQGGGPKTHEAHPTDLTEKIKQTKMQTNQFRQIEKNSEINRENQILLSKLVEISSGKYSTLGPGKGKAKKKKVKASTGGVKSLNYGQRRAEYERIERENAAFAKRLLNK